MSDLPGDWSRHPSSSNPGHVFYFNKRTGAKTWEIEEVLRFEESNKAKRRPSTDYSISELEKMLEEKRKEEERKRKLPETKPSSGQEMGKKEEIPTKRRKVLPKSRYRLTSVPEVKESNSRVTRSSSIRKLEPEVTKSFKTTPTSISKPLDTIPKRTLRNKGNQKEKMSMSIGKMSKREEKDVGEIRKKLRGYKIPINSPPPYLK